LYIYDITGIRVMSKTGPELNAGNLSLEISLAGLPDGQYMFEAVSDNDMVSGKVVVIRE